VERTVEVIMNNQVDPVLGDGGSFSEQYEQDEA